LFLLPTPFTLLREDNGKDARCLFIRWAEPTEKKLAGNQRIKKW
jgi:hypothetical protein